MTEVPLIHDMEKQIRGIRSVSKVADFIDHQKMGLEVSGEGIAGSSMRSRDGQVIHQSSSGTEKGCETILDGTVRDGDR
jgi:hypothetical protein